MTMQPVQFLQALFHGADLDSIARKGLNETTQTLGEDLQETLEGLIRKQQIVQGQIGPVIERAKTLNIVESEQERLESCQKKVLVLETAEKELKKAVSDKSRELQDRKQSIQALRVNLAALRTNVQPPPPTDVENFIIEFGQRAAKRMGEK
jgi:hypothetical protein